ncbi:MAG: family 20 glycosylhydrolase [Clostridia bacterium]|nr:family 20 glycosylhydrolase [Clostridia bacterium]
MDMYLIQLDLARQKESIEYIKSYADFAKKCGYNTLFLYLENVIRTKNTQFFNKEDTYSLEEMAEIVDYAEGIGLEVVPCFEVLPHVEKFLQYKELEHLSECLNGKNKRFDDGLKNGTCACVSSPELKKFVAEYVTEAASVFHGKYIHLGLDEPFDFAECERCKEELKKGKTKADLFLEYTLFCHELARSLGKRMLMNDDFFEYFDIAEKLPRDIIFTTWSYVFVSDDIPGHWTGKIKRDALRTYDKLGFEYIVLCYAHHSSATYNVDSLYHNYAKKYNLKGMCTTAWCHSESFYLGSYPFMEYAAALFQGRISGRKDAIDIFKKYCDGNEEIAEILYTLNLPNHFFSHKNFEVLCEQDYFIKFIQKRELDYFMPRLKAFKEKCENDVFTDIYNNILLCYLDFEIQRVGSEFYTQTEMGNVDKAGLIQRLEKVKEGYAGIRLDCERLWKKYRVGIKSNNHDFERKYDGYDRLIENIIGVIENNQKTGLLYLDLMLQDGFSTVSMEIRIRYAGEEEQTVFVGSLKPTLVNYDTCGTYLFKFLIENKPVEYVVLSVFGEGNQYVENVRVLTLGDKRLPSQVEAIKGRTVNVENVLLRDNSFADLGYESGCAHVNDLSLARDRSEIKIYF